MIIDRAAIASLASELSLACRILADQEIIDAFGQISARLPAMPDCFVINRAMSPALATESDFLVSSCTGEIVWGEGQSNSEWPIHAAIYRARPDVASVLHSHSRLSRIFSVSRHKLRGLLTSSGPEWQEGVPVYRKPGLITNISRGEELATVLGSRSAALLRGHGDVYATSSVRRTVMKAITLKQNADVLHEALSHGGEIDLWTPAELEVWAASEVQGMSPEQAAALASRAWDYYVARVDGRLAKLLNRN